MSPIDFQRLELTKYTPQPTNQLNSPQMSDFLLVCVDSSTTREEGDAAGGKGPGGGKSVGGKSIKIFGPGEKGGGGKGDKAARGSSTTTVTAVRVGHCNSPPLAKTQISATRLGSGDK